MQDSSMYRQWQSSHIGGSNAAYVDELYESYLTDPNSVPEDWRAYFSRRWPFREADGTAHLLEALGKAGFPV